MFRIAHPILVAAGLSLAAAIATAAPAAQGQAPAKAAVTAKAAPAKAVAEPAKPIASLVQYPELEKRVGDTVIVETTFDTVRRGKLIKYTNVGLTLQLGPENGSIELDIPRETVRNVSVMAKDAEQPAADKQETGSAKKN